MIKGYEKYKDSGVEWIGEIPEGWEVKKLKYLISSLESGVSVNATDLPAEGEAFGILKTSCVYEYRFNPEENKAIWESELPRAKVSPRKGSIIISRMNTPDLVGASGYVALDYPNLFLPDRLWQTVFHKHVEIDAKWLSYIFVSNAFRKILSVTATGTSPSMKNLGQEEFTNIQIPYLKIVEQTTIASFLDRKTAEIDQLIARKEKLIALYAEEKTAIINHVVTKGLDPLAKTKPSGIEWLGDIPEHWEVKRLKYVASMKSGEGITSDQITESGDYLVYGGNGLRGYFDSFTHEGNYALIGRQGALCGNINYASGKFWASEHAIVCTLVDNDEVKWFGELLKTMNLNQYSVSAAQPGLSVENIKVLQIPIPPQSEQTVIVGHIETECARLDTIIDKFKKQIELFKEYRTTLISEVVTGKIDVRDEVAE